MNYNVFGSETSLDYDIMVYVDAIPPIQQCKELCTKLEEELAVDLPYKKRNVNLAVVEDGVITKVFKGTPDECNNSVLATYHFHQQNQNLPITRRVPRNVPLKIARGIRIILSFLSRTEHRELVKKALRGSTADKLAALECIPFKDIHDLGKNNQDVVEFYKHAAFQIGQCMALMDGAELYTKKDIASYCPSLEKYVNRLPQDGGVLDAYKRWMIDSIRRTYKDVEIIKEER